MEEVRSVRTVIINLFIGPWKPAKLLKQRIHQHHNLIILSILSTLPLTNHQTTQLPTKKKKKWNANHMYKIAAQYSQCCDHNNKMFLNTF